MRARFLIILFVCLFIPSFSSAETIISSSDSVITQDTTWTTLGSPYLITEDLIVEEGATLTIEEGVTLKFEYGTGLIVFGNINIGRLGGLRANLTSIYDISVGGDPFDFGTSEGIMGDWYGVVILDSSSSSNINNANIKYSEKGVTFLNSEKAYFNEVNFEENGKGLYFSDGEVDINNLIFNKTERPIGVSNTVANVRGLKIGDVYGLNGFYNVITAWNGSTLNFTDVLIENILGGGISVYGESDIFIEDIVLSNINGDSVKIYNDSSGTIENLKVENSGPILVYNNSNLSIHGGLLEDMKGSNPLGAYSNSSFFIKDIEIKEVEAPYPLIVFNNTVLDIQDSSFDGGLGEGIFMFDGVNANIKNTKIRNFEGSGIWGRYPNTYISIEDSIIENNSYGLFVVDDANISIKQSRIANNNIGIETYFATQSINAKNNYWGKSSGPFNQVSNPEGEGNSVSDFVDFSPWLTSDPLSGEKCCSSVIFLPGIKGSVLEKVNVTKENDRLWPPAMFSNDVVQLEINENGTSKYPIVVDGIIDTFYKTKVYSEFSEFMDNLSTIDENTGTSTIKEWLPLAYDWRFSPEKIINEGIQTKSDGHIDVIERIEELAQNSNTGKVSIVAHSMGGLLGKEIIKKMEELGKSHLIESFVMVGTPQLGTPQAIGSLLHGDGESIIAAFLVIASKYDMRDVGQNMQSAFNLLPSELYFEKVSDPVIIFNNKASFTQDWRDYWGDSISSYSDFTEFLTGEGVVREEPMSTELLKPEVLRSDLLEHSKNIHTFYDEYKMLSNIRVVQVAGWGIPTLKGIEYKNHHRMPSYEAIFTKEGDSTVVYPSAVLPDLGEVYYFNLFNYNESYGSEITHRNLLSGLPIQELIIGALHNEVDLGGKELSVIKPPMSELDKMLLVSSHSPVILGVYDDAGNYTGVDLNQDMSADYLHTKQEIPGSYFVSLGDSQYIFLPKESGYNFVFKSVGTGEVTIKISDYIEDKVEVLNTYTDIEIQENSSATFALNTENINNVVIKLDQDGDGIEDSIIKKDEEIQSIYELLNILKTTISQANIKNNLKQRILKRIENFEKVISKKISKNDKLLQRVEDRINRKIKNSEEINQIIIDLEKEVLYYKIDKKSLDILRDSVLSLDTKQPFKNNILKQIDRLENINKLVLGLSNLNNFITINNGKMKINEEDFNQITSVLDQIEKLIK